MKTTRSKKIKTPIPTDSVAASNKNVKSNRKCKESFSAEKPITRTTRTKVSKPTVSPKLQTTTEMPKIKQLRSTRKRKEELIEKPILKSTLKTVSKPAVVSKLSDTKLTATVIPRKDTLKSTKRRNVSRKPAQIKVQKCTVSLVNLNIENISFVTKKDKTFPKPVTNIINKENTLKTSKQLRKTTKCTVSLKNLKGNIENISSVSEKDKATTKPFSTSETENMNEKCTSKYGHRKRNENELDKLLNKNYVAVSVKRLNNSRAIAGSERNSKKKVTEHPATAIKSQKSKPYARLPHIKNTPLQVEKGAIEKQKTPVTNVETSPVAHQPVYKQTLEQNNQKSLCQESSIYDYISNSQDFDLPDDPMKDVIEKLKRENKIDLKKKHTRKQNGPKKKPVPVNRLKQMAAKHGLKTIKTILQDALLQKEKPTKTQIIEEKIIDIISDGDDNHSVGDAYNDDNDDFPPVENPSNLFNVSEFEKPLKTNAVSTPIRTVTDGPPSFTHLHKKISNMRKDVLQKPVYQSTPKQNIGQASPWRVGDENVPAVFYFSTSTDHLPTYSSDVVVQDKLSNNSKDSINQTSSNVEHPKQLDFSDRQPSTSNNENTIVSNDNSENTLYISNIENIAPEMPNLAKEIEYFRCYCT